MVHTLLADGPRGGFQPVVCRILCEFLLVFRLIHFVSGFLLHEVLGRSVLECRQSVIEGAVLEVRGHFSDSSP
jgi:hypothetical protein